MYAESMNECDACIRCFDHWVHATDNSSLKYFQLSFCREQRTPWWREKVVLWKFCQNNYCVQSFVLSLSHVLLVLQHHHQQQRWASVGFSASFLASSLASSSWQQPFSLAGYSSPPFIPLLTILRTLTILFKPKTYHIQHIKHIDYLKHLWPPMWAPDAWSGRKRDQRQSTAEAAATEIQVRAFLLRQEKTINSIY